MDATAASTENGAAADPPPPPPMDATAASPDNDGESESPPLLPIDATAVSVESESPPTVDIDAAASIPSNEDDDDGAENRYYLQLTNGKQSPDLRTQNPDGTFRCPFCPAKKKQNYLHNEILQHAIGIGSSCSSSRTSSQTASHRALASFLLDLSPKPKNPSQDNADADESDKDDKDDRFVYPWTGVVANIPTKVVPGSNIRAGGSGSKLREQLARFSPVQVRPVWNYLGHSGFALVEFGKDWKGFNNVSAFHRHFAAAKCGKTDWLKGKGSKESEIFGWVAKASDFNSDCPLGQQLQKKGELMTVDELSNGTTRKKEQLRAKLKEQIVEKDRDLEALKTKYSEENVLVDKMMEERKKRLESYNDEVRKLRNLALNHTRQVVEDNEKLRFQLENKCTELDALVLETNKKKRTLEDEQALKRKKIALQNATLEQRKADENVMEAIKQQQREKEVVTEKMLQLEKQLEVKQQLELEIEHLKGKVQIMTHMVSDSDIEIKEKVFQLNKELREKIEEMEDLEALNQALVVKESSSRTELEQAHKELVTVLSEMTTTNSKIHVKVVDELNMVQELWRKSGRKATLNEALQFLIDTWKGSRKY